MQCSPSSAEISPQSRWFASRRARRRQSGASPNFKASMPEARIVLKNDYLIGAPSGSFAWPNSLSASTKRRCAWISVQSSNSLDSGRDAQPNPPGDSSSARSPDADRARRPLTGTDTEAAFVTGPALRTARHQSLLTPLRSDDQEPDDITTSHKDCPASLTRLNRLITKT